MQLSSAEKTLYVKIVYYGPGLSGKTTNLEAIHRLTDPSGQKPMVSLRTQEDRTLFFDLLPIDLGRLFGLSIRIKLYTVPGQIQYDTTRRQVLAGADGVVFVADSQRAEFEPNQRMVRYLVNNLESNGLDPKTIPLVYQWNKQDLPDLLPIEELKSRLDPRRCPSFPAVAPRGEGVLETFQEIAALTLESIARRASSSGDKMRAETMRSEVERAFVPFFESAARAKKELAAEMAARTARTSDPSLTAVRAAGSDNQQRNVLGLDDLLSEAVQANLAISEQLVGSQAPQRAMRRERQALVRMVQVATVTTAPQAVLRAALGTALAGLDLSLGSVLLSEGQQKPMRELFVTGADQDPLNGIQPPGIGSLAQGLLDRQDLILCNDIEGELLFGQPHDALAGVRSVALLPIGRAKQARAALVVYAKTTGRDLGPDDLDYLRLVGGIADLAIRAGKAEASRPVASSPATPRR